MTDTSCDMMSCRMSPNDRRTEKTVKLRGITIIMSKFADADRPE